MVFADYRRQPGRLVITYVEAPPELRGTGAAGRLMQGVIEAARAEEVKVRSSIEISPDPKDDPFCLCSQQGNAGFIVTLNPRDFPEDRLKAKVVPPSHLQP